MYMRFSNATWSVARLSLSLDHAVTTQPLAYLSPQSGNDFVNDQPCKPKPCFLETA